MTSIRSQPAPRRPLPPAQPSLGALSPRALEQHLDASVKSPDARTVRRVVLNVLAAGVKPSNPGLTRWLDRNALPALRAATPAVREGVVRQLEASGFSRTQVMRWSTGGFGVRLPPR